MNTADAVLELQDKTFVAHAAFDGLVELAQPELALLELELAGLAAASVAVGVVV